MEKSSKKLCTISTQLQILESLFITVSQIKYKVIELMFGDVMVSVSNNLLFMVMWKDQWTENPNLQTLGGKNIKDIVEDSLLKSVNLKTPKNSH